MKVVDHCQLEVASFPEEKIEVLVKERHPQVEFGQDQEVPQPLEVDQEDLAQVQVPNPPAVEFR